MIIHKPEIKQVKQEIHVSAKIELENKRIRVPEEMWFRFPESYKKFISNNSDGFVVSLLLVGMALKEDIEVKGNLSPQLLYNLKEYQKIFNSWCPKEFKLINIKAANLKIDKRNQKAICCAFSGGVDSFYTLWKHLPQNESIKEHQLSHAFFIHGFDIPLEDKTTYEIEERAYKKIMNRLGIKFLTTKINSRDFVSNLN